MIIIEIIASIYFIPMFSCFFNASWCSAVVEFTVKYCKWTHHHKKCLGETVIEGSGWLQVFVDKIHIVFKILQKELLK